MLPWIARVKIIFLFPKMSPDDALGTAEETLALEGFLRKLLRENPDVRNPNIVTDPAGADGILAAVMYAPLRVHGELLGLLTLARTAGQREFNAGEEKLLLALAGQAAGAIEKAMLHQQDLQHQHITHELVVSRRIQRSLLPQGMPTLPGWEFAASYQAASQVGGDFYDIFSLSDETGCQDARQYGLTIADVSGKGIPAALMMAFVQGILHNVAFSQQRPAGVLSHTNQSILQSSHSGLLLTAFYAVLDPCTGSLAYANGGHEPPILYRAATAECRELACGSSLLLGARREYPVREYETQMEPGDLLLLYTDGITEARNASGEFFAEERLNAVLMEYARHGSAVVITALNESLAQFTAGAPQSDDVTLLALRRLQ